ncbi:HAD-superfamily hydrolase, subfamily IA, variant 3 [Bifidobacterium actinocoloniiforme DSM 22766]|uniref:HAD-superfamily hydrolase, subfamily IA, variant 3 n=1 Tax=Bifidobacterium actinocoloniiforme DSM 22766 TaxID=1437605 RepID=A0A086Z1T0_9BIFI|nr:HAD family phosphatase [Bifidobacterium actinocoloniiforme]AKV55588.1 hypothetical protein AB656_04540 [Bifidobacterium actinocoloniiforme DSM 22766]KFI40480.1 HAD-superfamily hydrolase, subfamily IA, variant 3 [Bifidobacterium actinocoloniiforme DSM 22766]
MSGANAGVVDNVIFDFGGVLVDWQPRLALEGEYPDGVIDALLDPEDEWGFWRFNDLSDAGWSQERILADYESDHGPAVAWVLRTYFAHVERTFPAMIAGMEKLMEDLRASGLRLWGLSNISGSSAVVLHDKFEPIRRLDGIVTSGEEMVRKPDPLIYQLLLRRFGLEAGRCVFVDDRPVNVAAARKLGIHGLEFRGAQQLREDLRALGLEL